ncbi:hypothetical protein [Roseimicrobium sp. ORNL1]|uniref:hypothetical protein n=1 Tax=Roseimicrobium sp. ORNL1 TaxID=2711231 RepID=UPI0013E120B0|nr:hypothetical protein [Roseimicrobium sp. ORNL1]QIF00732.1 hypothetical protein G5S37_04075 [Roseimicrobium sp. ORNL1]
MISQKQIENYRAITQATLARLKNQSALALAGGAILAMIVQAAIQWHDRSSDSSSDLSILTWMVFAGSLQSRGDRPLVEDGHAFHDAHGILDFSTHGHGLWPFRLRRLQSLAGAGAVSIGHLGNIAGGLFAAGALPDGLAPVPQLRAGVESLSGLRRTKHRSTKKAATWSGGFFEKNGIKGKKLTQPSVRPA